MDQFQQAHAYELKIPLKELAYRVAFTGYNKEGGYAEFIFKVTAPHGFQFNLIDRYKRLRAFRKAVIRDVGRVSEFRSLPPFPRKTYSRKMSNKFLDQRRAELEDFFDAFLRINEVARSAEILKYFGNCCYDNLSQDKVVRLYEQISEKRALEQGITPRGPSAQEINSFCFDPQERASEIRASISNSFGSEQPSEHPKPKEERILEATDEGHPLLCPSDSEMEADEDEKADPMDDRGSNAVVQNPQDNSLRRSVEEDIREYKKTPLFDQAKVTALQNQVERLGEERREQNRIQQASLIEDSHSD